MQLKYPRYVANVMNQVLVLLVSICLVAGCTELSQNRNQAGLVEDFRNYLNQKINVMTYDQAIEQWGSPRRVTQSIGFFVATWIGEPQPPAQVSENTTTHGVPIISGRTLQLTFDKETKLLVSIDKYF
jgi:hypothetical protein